MIFKDAKSEDFKFVVLFNKLNLLVQIFLGLTFFLGMNFLAMRHYVKKDFSENMRNSLSPESAAYVRGLKQPVEFFAVMSRAERDPEGAIVKRELESLFRRYEYEALGNDAGEISVSFVNPHIESRRAQELVDKFGSDIENTVIISSGGNFRKIPISDFYDIEDGARKNFKGEQIVSSALLNVSKGKVEKIYFLTGHGEMRHRDTDALRGLSEFAGMLESRNFALEELDLSKSGDVPEDAGLVIIPSPQVEFLPRELDSLRKFLFKKNGSVAVFLDMGSLCGLDEILFEWGMRSDDMLILDSSGDYESSSGDLIVRGFPKKPHSMVRYLVDMGLPLQFGSTRPVHEDLGAPLDENLKLDVLVLSGATSWAEKSYRKAGMQNYDDAVDLLGPIPLAMAASRRAGSELGMSIPGGKLVVFGDDNFIANRSFGRLGNSKLAMNAVSWVFEEENMLNIPARALNAYSLTLSHNDLLSLGMRFMIIPLMALLMGIVIYFVRKN